MFQPLSSLFTNVAAAACTLPTERYGIPTWYKYLKGQIDTTTGDCQVFMNFRLAKVQSLLSIGLAAIEIMLFFAGIIAFGYIIYGGFRYLLSQGNPENTKVAKDAILNAIIGLVIAIIASTVVRFIASTVS